MANLLFIKCITLWLILPRDLLRIRQGEPLTRTGIQAVHQERTDLQNIPLAE